MSDMKTFVDRLLAVARGNVAPDWSLESTGQSSAPLLPLSGAESFGDFGTVRAPLIVAVRDSDPIGALTYYTLDAAGLAWERKLRAAGYRVEQTPWAHVTHPREETKR